MEYKEIGQVKRGALEPGRLKVQVDGLQFKSFKSGAVLQVKVGEIVGTEWMRVARGHEVKVITEQNVFKFDGFKESDYSELKQFFRTYYHQDLKPVDLCVQGWNWGKIEFRGPYLSFQVDHKTAFEIPLCEVSQVISGKNEVSVEFHHSEDAPVMLTEMRFHIPNTEGEEDPVQALREKLLAKADVIQATGEAIASFAELHCLTPRGRYTIRVYPTFLHLHGKTFDYKIPFSTIARLFLLPHNDQKNMFFVLGLDPPIRQGQTRYHFVILSLQMDEECELTLTLSDEELNDKYDGKLAKEMSGALYEVFGRLLKVLVGRKLIVPGSFRKNNNQCAISCSHKATSGFLYPLDKGFIFVHKPSIYIKFSDISSVNFARMTGGAGVSRSFDFEVEIKDGNTYHFSSLMKDDYGRLYDFVTEKKITVRNKGKNRQVAYHDDASGDSDEHDAYLARMKAEGEERDSEDEDSDFVAGGSGSEDALEYDSSAKSDGSESATEGEERKVEDMEKVQKKRKSKPQSKPPAKKRKTDEKGAAKKESKRQKKDPAAPKKPLTAFMLFLQDQRESIKRKNSGVSVSEVAKIGGEMWKKQEDKSKWQEKAKQMKAQYQKDLAAYQASGGASNTPPFSSSSSHKKSSPVKGSSKKTKSSNTGSASSSKFKSAEFVDTSDEEEREGKGMGERRKEKEKQKHVSDAPASTGTTQRHVTRSRKGGGGGELVSLPSEGESESEAEASTSASESESD